MLALLSNHHQASLSRLTDLQSLLSANFSPTMYRYAKPSERRGEMVRSLWVEALVLDRFLDLMRASIAQIADPKRIL